MISTLLCLCAAFLGGEQSFDVPAVPFNPRQYVCRFVSEGPAVDGRLDDPVWQTTAFSELFLDIEGTARPAPLYDTQVAMVFDNTYLYIGARLDEPHVWGTLQERDSIIFQDNDFEVFIDPDGDTHKYYELEINALGTVWDLFLTKPYRDGGTALHDWNIPGLKTAVHVLGTRNDPGDRDRGWTLEIALPWAALMPAAGTLVPPAHGDHWRMNFSRVQWRTDTADGGYRKKTDPKTGQPLPEQNWVWSPQGLINMHYPEMWGYVVFVRADGVPPAPGFKTEEAARMYLRRLYYAQRRLQTAGKTFSADLKALGFDEAVPEGYAAPALYATPSLFEAVLQAADGRHALHLTSDGRIWRQDLP